MLNKGYGGRRAVHQLEDVGPSNGDRLIKRLAAAAIDQLDLAGVLGVVDPLTPWLLRRFFEVALNGFTRLFSSVHLVKRDDLEAGIKVVGGPAHQALKDLSDIHPARHTQGVEHDVDRRAIGQVGHVLQREDAANDALVAMGVRFIIQFTWLHRLLWELLTLGGLINEHSLRPLLRWLIRHGYPGTAMELLRLPLNRIGVRALFQEARLAGLR